MPLRRVVLTGLASDLFNRLSTMIGDYAPERKPSSADGSRQAAGDETTPQGRTEFGQQKNGHGEEIAVTVTSLSLVTALFLPLNKSSAVIPKAA